MDMQIHMSAYSQFKQEALKALKQQETNILNEKEKEIQLELNTIQQTLAVKKEQLQAYKQACKEAKDNNFYSESGYRRNYF